ncbi:hypothetical protein R6Q59_030174 [Mikania micrantha]
MGADLEDEFALPGLEKSLGLKRARQTYDEHTFVKINFNLLSRKSKKKLEELLHQWSEWHAQECSLSEGTDEDLECGEETYFPALNVSTDKSCTISFYMDNQKKKKQRVDDVHFNKGSAPIYNRNYECSLGLEDELGNKESILDFINAPRCFNCDAYDHSLKECPKSFNKDAVNNARNLYESKNKRSFGPRVLTRYYQDTPGGKFDGLKPGCLDPETRKLLGIGEFDPPPWLNRMREMGYPPGYVDLEDDNQPSGINIYSNIDTKEENEERINTSSKDPERKMTVDFPGINAPIPVNADQNCWTYHNIKPVSFNSYSNKNCPLNHKIGSFAELHSRGHFHKPPDCILLPNYAPTFPLLSNYANNYLHHINQSTSHYSSYAYHNSWSSFHGG